MYCHILRVRAIPTLESTDSMTFIPKPKHMDIRDLFKDTKQFVSKMRTRYETFN